MLWRRRLPGGIVGLVQTGVGVSEDDRPFALRLARYCARNPLALDRLTYDPATEQL